MATLKGRRQPKAVAASTAKASVAAIDPAEALDDNSHPDYKHLHRIASGVNVPPPSTAGEEIDKLCLALLNERGCAVLQDAARQLISAGQFSPILRVIRHHLGVLTPIPTDQRLSPGEHRPLKEDQNWVVVKASSELRGRAQKVLLWLSEVTTLELKHLGVTQEDLKGAVMSCDTASGRLLQRVQAHIGKAIADPGFVDGPVQAAGNHRPPYKRLQFSQVWHSGKETAPRSEVMKWLRQAYDICRKTAYNWTAECIVQDKDGSDVIARDRLKTALKNLDRLVF